MMDFLPRVYVSSPFGQVDDVRSSLREAILGHVRNVGFEPQEFHVSGLPRGDAWSSKRSLEVMKQCDGALILALARWVFPNGDAAVPVPTEYNHFEGALAIAEHLPTLAIAEEGMLARGILNQGGNLFVIRIPIQNAASWISGNRLLNYPAFQTWVERIHARKDVFLGYCSKANPLVNNIKKYLLNEGFSVLDWATDFRPGRTIMEEVARAAANCRCGLFLFTADDPIEGNQTVTAIPRDNVVLEAGYFTSARGSSRVVIVRESGTKMPADLGGIIYLSIEDRNDWQKTAEIVASSLRHIMTTDAA